MLRKINEALLGAYDIESLSRLVKFELGEDLGAIVDISDFTATVFHLTAWAEKNGKLRILVDAAKQERPNNEALQSLDIPLLRKTILSQGGSDLMSFQAVNLEVLTHHVRDLQEKVKELKQILTGPTGANGVNSISRQNQRDIKDISERLTRIEKAIAQGPDLFASTSSRIVFGFIIFVLGATGLIVAGELLGFIG